ncbi:MAG: hypothetical protein EOM91_05790 [Sphingobacteriia bacterium]|nr:hypothetical protein [Sphingobacteriia bacterium]NCC40298.1 hypothetical protein [Gammaproteobacteria bacterium]
MDRFTRNVIILFGIMLVLLALSLVSWDRLSLRPRIWQLNGILSDDPVLSAYPYDFRALLFMNGIVTLTRPYDERQVPITQFLAVVDPSLVGRPAEDPLVMAAADRLRQLERHAIMLMLAEPDVDSVIWSLDRARLTRLGIVLPAGVH